MGGMGGMDGTGGTGGTAGPAGTGKPGGTRAIACFSVDMLALQLAVQHLKRFLSIDLEQMGSN